MDQKTLSVVEIEKSKSAATHFLECGMYDPHAFLGIHRIEEGKSVIRVYRPGATRMHIEVCGIIVEMRLVHEAGFFEVYVSDSLTYKDYRVFHASGLLAYDPYAFWPTLGELDQYLFSKGVHYDLYRKMGGRLVEHQGVKGASFAVWAPSAKSVSLVCDCNHFDGRSLPMRSMGISGIFELFVPGLEEGCLYKFEIVTQAGQTLVKTDPFGVAFELRPKTAAVLANMDAYSWNDNEWMESRRNSTQNRPISVYEVHLGSWQKDDWKFLNYRDLGERLSIYCQEMGFTHVELMPVAEHPLDESWGYQVTGYFAPTSRFGTFQDFQYFVDILHQHGIGVILDWVPGHFPMDDFALARFDGTALFEHEDVRQGIHPHWNTLIFNYGRIEVSNFLIASALFWLDVLHIDGLRVDAVASMLYLDYGRNEGEWIPNQWGGKENVDAIEFLRHTNSIVHTRHPGVLMIAEESTSFCGVTHSLDGGGLGFDLKWNMGWMNDTLRYFQKDPLFRSYHHNDLTFGLLYAFSEKFALVFSHDEVVHGKGSLLSKMPGDTWQRLANLRLLFSYMMCQPGKKLFFMGSEIGQWEEWCSQKEIPWSLTNFPSHRGIQICVQELNHFYLQAESLYADDHSYRGFEWVHCNDYQNSILSYIRKVPNSPKALLCVHNFTPNYFAHYELPLKYVSHIKEVFNTDETRYGGSGKVKGFAMCYQNNHGHYSKAVIALPPLATVMYDVTWV